MLIQRLTSFVETSVAVYLLLVPGLGLTIPSPHLPGSIAGIAFTIVFTYEICGLLVRVEAFVELSHGKCAKCTGM
ncbi:hypothetical protein D3C80_1735440 [compost metagenome]